MVTLFSIFLFLFILWDGFVRETNMTPPNRISFGVDVMCLSSPYLDHTNVSGVKLVSGVVIL